MILSPDTFYVKMSTIFFFYSFEYFFLFVVQLFSLFTPTIFSFYSNYFLYISLSLPPKYVSFACLFFLSSHFRCTLSLSKPSVQCACLFKTNFLPYSMFLYFFSRQTLVYLRALPTLWFWLTFCFQFSGFYLYHRVSLYIVNVRVLNFVLYYRLVSVHISVYCVSLHLTVCLFVYLFMSAYLCL